MAALASQLASFAFVAWHSIDVVKFRMDIDHRWSFLYSLPGSSPDRRKPPTDPILCHADHVSARHAPAKPELFCQLQSAVLPGRSSSCSNARLSSPSSGLSYSRHQFSYRVNVDFLVLRQNPLTTGLLAIELDL